MLYTTLQVVSCNAIAFSRATDEVFYNFKESIRGSIRKPPNAMTWVHSLMALVKCGENDPAGVIRTWNFQASRNSQITGEKAQSIKNIMELMPQDAYNSITDLVAKIGWERSPWSDMALGNKKIYPGFVPRGASKAWNERTKISRASMILMVDHISHQASGGEPNKSTSHVPMRANNLNPNTS